MQCRSTAGNATITNNRTVSFQQHGTAGNATIINNFDLDFADTSTAGNATIITNNNGNNILWKFGEREGRPGSSPMPGGEVDISELTGAGTTAGSIEGAGTLPPWLEELHGRQQ